MMFFWLWYFESLYSSIATTDTDTDTDADTDTSHVAIVLSH